MNNIRHYYIDDEAKPLICDFPHHLYPIWYPVIDYEFEDDDVYQLSEKLAQLKLRPMKRKR